MCYTQRNIPEVKLRWVELRLRQNFESNRRLLEVYTLRWGFQTPS